MIHKYDFLILLLAVPFIALSDWVIFQKWTQCEKCGAKLNKWYNYLLPTLIEVLFFFAGFAIAMVMMQ